MDGFDVDDVLECLVLLAGHVREHACPDVPLDLVASSSPSGSSVPVRTERPTDEPGVRWRGCLIDRRCIADPLGISRTESRDMGAFTGKILSAMRSEPGCHAEKEPRNFP